MSVNVGVVRAVHARRLVRCRHRSPSPRYWTGVVMLIGELAGPDAAPSTSASMNSRREPPLGIVTKLENRANALPPGRRDCSLAGTRAARYGVVRQDRAGLRRRVWSVRARDACFGPPAGRRRGIDRARDSGAQT